ncbi:Uncharacterised protein [Lysinibacillus capsici]|uniref:Uncharacterized protein n=1 Tax=Lysinibacillus capsici TaxID=2115968 RepID=A0A2X1A6A9_9BACI|nr:hypothetical protein [Lysinibacillus capsici]SPU40708.1 Uncharacterised protein [Lysinibacillus capsici]
MKRILNVFLENRKIKNELLQEEINFNNTKRELKKTVNNIQYYLRWENYVPEVEEISRPISDYLKPDYQLASKWEDKCSNLNESYYTLLKLQSNLAFIYKYISIKSIEGNSLLNALYNELILLEKINKMYTKGIRFDEQVMKEAIEVILERTTFIIAQYKKEQLEPLLEELEITKKLRAQWMDNNIPYVDSDGVLLKSGDQVTWQAQNLTDGTMIKPRTVYNVKFKREQLYFVAPNGQEFNWSALNYSTGPYFCSVCKIKGENEYGS